MKRSITLAAAMIAAAISGAQAPLSVDTSFRVDLPAQNVRSLAFMANGQFLLSGQMEFPDDSGVRALARINPEGSRDLSFPFTYGGAKLTPWQDRFYVGAGTVRRLMPDGTIDNSFQNMNFDPYFISGQGGDYHVFPDGRVLLGGYHSIEAEHLNLQGDYNLVWFFNNGRLDTTRTHRTGNGAVFGLKQYPQGTAGGLDGKFLVHHWGTQYEGQAVSKVFRIHADGSLDESFNAPIPWGYVWAMEPLPDGRAYLGGTFRLENETDTIQLIRVMPDGSLDPTFNNTIDFTMDASHLALDAAVLDVEHIGHGLLALAGEFSEVEGQARGGLCIVDTTGQVVQHYLDAAGCGNYDYQIGMMTITYGALEGITRAPSGDYYIWGAYHGYNDGTTNDTLQRMVTRLHGGEIGLGVQHARTEEQPMRLYPNPASGFVTVELERVPTAAMLVVRDALGRIVMEQGVNGYINTFSVHGLGEGMYNLELLQHGKRIDIQRVVVQH
ncbi:MAG: T9SS type A sorting domain-containing protein [Flavobacteriales bacterium]|nr:T9SS type A sorting domain-containing protein [Flavobacteriales bacterium]